VDWNSNHVCKLPEHKVEGQLGKTNINNQITDRFTKPVSNIRTNDNTKGKVFNCRDEDDYSVKHFAESKTILASKKTQSNVVLGEDRPDVQKEFHVNRNDKVKSEKLNEMKGYEPKWVETQPNAVTMKNIFVYGTDYVDTKPKTDK